MPRDDHGSPHDEPASARDEELSAYLDGELEPAAEQELRQALSDSPALAERLARLGRVDEELRQLVSRPAPTDLGERLRARIAAEQDEARPEAAHEAPRRHAASRRARWLVPGLAAAAAAALALVVLPRLRGGDEAPRIAEPQQTRPAPIQVAEDPVPAPSEPSAAPSTGELEPSPVEIATALVIEEEADLDVIELLDWLEEMGDLQTSGRS